jgi:hypothetical protein
MNRFLIIPASDIYAKSKIRNNFKKTVLNQINLLELFKNNLINETKYNELLKIYPNGKANI